MRKLAIFDVCGTLYTVNTTFDFIRFYHRKKKNYFRWILVSLFQSKFGKLFNKFFGFSLRKHIILSLRNETKLDVGAISKIYVRDELPRKECKLAFDFMKYCKLDSSIDEVFLMSASIDPVISSVAQELNVSYGCSELEIKDGRYTGNLAKDLKGDKINLIKDSDVVFFASDNHDDFDLGLISRRYVIFTKKKNYNYWMKRIEGIKHEGITIEVI